MKTLLPWLKANLILQTPAALGLFHNGQVCWEGLPGRGGVCARVHVRVRVHACMSGGLVHTCVLRRAPAVSSKAAGGGGPGPDPAAGLAGRPHGRPGPPTAEAKGPNW